MGAAASCIRQGGVAEILMLAGKGWLEWGPTVLQEFEAMAKANGLDRVKFAGRRGWARIMPGYRVMTASDGRVEMEKTL